MSTQYTCYNNYVHLILTTTIIRNLNGFNQPTKMNTFSFMGNYVTKLEKGPYDALIQSEFFR